MPFGDQAEYVNPHTQMWYDNNGNVLQVTDPNGNATLNTYDAAQPSHHDHRWRGHHRSVCV